MFYQEFKNLYVTKLYSFSGHLMETVNSIQQLAKELTTLVLS